VLLPPSPVTARRLHKHLRSHAEDKRRVATPLATSAACTARAEADARQETADIQRALRISVADQPGPALTALIGGSTAILPDAETMCDAECATAAAAIGLDAFARDLTSTPVCRTLEAVPTMVNATLKQPRSEVTLLQHSNPFTSAVGSTIVANCSPSSALLPQCAPVCMLPRLVTSRIVLRASHTRRRGHFTLRRRGGGTGPMCLDRVRMRRAPPVHGGGGWRTLLPLVSAAHIRREGRAGQGQNRCIRPACELGAPCSSHEDPSGHAVSAAGDASRSAACHQ
jgi:hypothetical protein